MDNSLHSLGSDTTGDRRIPPSFDWTERDIERLRKMLERGFSFRRIGVEIGCGRNSAIGKAHRLGLSSTYGRVEWTPAVLAQLRELHGSGLSAAATARAMKLPQRAVHHKAKQFGLTFRRTRTMSLRAPRPQLTVPRMVRTPEGNMITVLDPELPQERQIETAPLNVALLDLEWDSCRWPYGTDSITFCGHRKLYGSSYCPAHKAMSVRGPRTSRN